MKNFLLILFYPLILFAQEEVIIYWNSLATDVTVGVPLADDNSLIGGRIQVKVSFDGGKSFKDMGDPSSIDKGDTDDIKSVSIPAEIFEGMNGFSEGGKAQFIATVWDRAGNNVTGSVSDSILTIDETPPILLDLKNISSNTNKSLAMPDDSITFQMNTNEAIKKPLFDINGEIYENTVGTGKSWMLVYPASDAEDGPLKFIINYTDLAGNPGDPISIATDSLVITMDGTSPELTEVNLKTSNSYDQLLAVEGDTVFLKFTSSEFIKDINAILNNSEAKLYKEENLNFIYFHVFTESDSQGVIPIILDYRDQAGNMGETIDETDDESEVTLDMNPPSDFKVETVGSLYGDSNRKQKRSKGANVESKSNQNFEFGLIPIIIASYLGLTILVYIVSMFIIFSKAGQAGWKAIVPFFNLFVFTKISGKPAWWIAIYLIIPIGYIIASLDLSKLFGKKIIFSIGLILLPIIFYPLLAFGKAHYVKPKS